MSINLKTLYYNEKWISSSSFWGHRYSHLSNSKEMVMIYSFLFSLIFAMLQLIFGLLQHDTICRLWQTHVGLVLFQDNMPRELGLWHRGKLLNDVLQGLQASHPQLITVVCGCHESHADQVRQMEHQQVTWTDGRWEGSQYGLCEE